MALRIEPDAGFLERNPETLKPSAQGQAMRQCDMNDFAVPGAQQALRGEPTRRPVVGQDTVQAHRAVHAVDENGRQLAGDDPFQRLRLVKADRDDRSGLAGLQQLVHLGHHRIEGNQAHVDFERMGGRLVQGAADDVLVELRP